MSETENNTTNRLIGDFGQLLGSFNIAEYPGRNNPGYIALFVDTFSLKHRMHNPETAPFIDILGSRAKTNTLVDGLEKAVAAIDRERLRQALELRFDLEDRIGTMLTLKEVGIKMGVGEERARQLIFKAESHIRFYCKTHPLYWKP